MAIEYLGLNAINGPMAVLEGVRDAAYDEIVEMVTNDGKKKLGRTSQVPSDGMIIPFRIFTVVVFPAPFGPRKPNTSPSLRAMLMCSTARFPPGYCFVISFMITAFFIVPLSCRLRHLFLYDSASFGFLFCSFRHLSHLFTLLLPAFLSVHSAADAAQSPGNAAPLQTRQIPAVLSRLPSCSV